VKRIRLRSTALIVGFAYTLLDALTHVGAAIICRIFNPNPDNAYSLLTVLERVAHDHTKK